MTFEKTKFELNYEAYIDGTAPVSDTMRRVSRAFLLLSVALSKVTVGQTQKVKSIADQMNIVHDYMTLVNDKLNAAGANPAENELIVLFEGDKWEDVDAARKAFLTAANGMGDVAGKDDQFSVYDGGTSRTPRYYFPLFPASCTLASKNLQLHVDDLSSLSQQEQLALQTLMSRYNGAIEAATSATQKTGTQAQAIIRAIVGGG